MYPKDSCHSLIIGSTNTGKTHYILNLLKTHYYKCFDNIVIFCPTLMDNKTYKRCKFVWQDNNIYIVNPQNRLDQSLSYYYNQFKSSESSTLFIIDDCSAEKSIVKKREMLSQIAFSGRHVGISIWMLTQKFNAVSKDFRENIKWTCIFYTKDRDSFEECLRENDVVPFDKIKEIKDQLKSKKHAKLILRLEQPTDYFVDLS